MKPGDLKGRVALALPWAVVCGELTRCASPNQSGVVALEPTGPVARGRVVSECYPYTTLVGVPELGYDDDDKRPQYKRASTGVRTAEAWPIRVGACDELIRRMSRLADFDPPVDMASHTETRRLVEEHSPKGWRDYKPREDLLDAVICAWTAAYWQRHGADRCMVLGGPEQPENLGLVATIIAPARPKQRTP